jgi:ribonuclease R
MSLYLPRLLEVLKHKQYIPLPVERLAEKLGLPADEQPAFKREVGQHLRSGTLVKLKKNRICLPRDADLVTGVIRFRQSGSAILIADLTDGPTARPPLQIAAEDTWVAMHGDRVVCRIHHDRRAWRVQRERKGASRQPEAESARVIRILERARETITGTLQRGRLYHFVIPGDPRIIQDILVPDPANSQLRPRPTIGDKVVVRLAPWEQRHLNPEGEITAVLGRSHTPDAEYKALLHQYGLDPEFPEPVRREVAGIPAKVAPRALRGREDLRRQTVITIDPQDAKDFDDALSLEELANGNTVIGVHIADVAAYVTPGSALDREARRRGNSTYLVGKVLPMLPHELSNGICSLVEGEDRLTKSVFLTFNRNGKLAATRFANTVISSRKRLTYEQAHVLLTKDDPAAARAMPNPPAHQTGATGRPLAKLSDAELAELRGLVRKLWAIAERLRAARMRGGSLDLDMPETKIYVDADGWAERIVKIEHNESHQLVEEFMLAANEAVARALNERNHPALHRVHDKPDEDRLADFAEYLKAFAIAAGDLGSRKVLNGVLDKIRAHPQQHILRLQFLRSLKQACYRASADGHFGLAKRHYTHFTSPIRRYADLVIHRLFNQHLAADPAGGKPARIGAAELGDIARHVSLTEQNSTEAERESVKLKLLEFFERELKKKRKSRFDAVIMDITNHGMFVELSESLAYGLVHISTLQDDLYRVSSDRSALIGRRAQRSYRIGQKIQVVAHRVDRFKRQIDFAVA